jgi:hypothetical protein
LLPREFFEGLDGAIGFPLFGRGEPSVPTPVDDAGLRTRLVEVRELLLQLESRVPRKWPARFGGGPTEKVRRRNLAGGLPYEWDRSATTLLLPEEY